MSLLDNSFSDISSSDTENGSFNLLPGSDLEAGKFLNGYLERNIPLVSRFYESTDWDTFLNTKLCGIPILHLPYFISCYVQINKEKDGNAKDFWGNIDNLIANEFGTLIKDLYKYNELIEKLPGYENTKEYLLCALVQNNTIWIEFVSKCMYDAAQTLSGPNATSSSEI